MEKIVEYSDTKKFWDEVSPHLKKDDAKNCLCLGLSYHFKDKPENCIYQSALFLDDQFVGSLVVSRYRTQSNLLISPIENQSYIKTLFNELNKKTRLTYVSLATIKLINIFLKLL